MAFEISSKLKTKKVKVYWDMICAFIKHSSLQQKAFSVEYLWRLSRKKALGKNMKSAALSANSDTSAYKHSVPR